MDGHDPRAEVARAFRELWRCMQLLVEAQPSRSILPGGFVIPRLFHWHPPVWPVNRRSDLPSPLTTPIILTRPVVSWRQLEIIFQPARLTPLALHIAEILRRLARSCSEMPDNPGLGGLAGGNGRSAIYRVLGRLEAAGVITIEKEPNRRRVLVHDIGCRTDWGPARPGHAPFTRRARGTSAPPKKEVIRLGAAPRVWDPDDELAADVCQYIVSLGRHLTKDPTMCGAPVLRGKSWCAGHHALLTKPGRPLTERFITQ
jgi:DNA-binding transcriptional ArsR family regulator